MKKMRFNSYHFHPFQQTLFMKREGDKIAVILLYVDDIILACNCDDLTDKIQQTLMKEF
jgi:hypothetical protein